MLLKRGTKNNWFSLIVILIGAFGFLFAAADAFAVPCDIKNNPPPFIQHDLSNSYCELCGYGYVTVVVSNPYSYTNVPGPDIPGAVMSNMTVVENLGISGLRYEPNAPDPVTYRINSGINQAGSAPAINGGGTTLTFTSTQIPPLANLESRAANNQFDSISIRFAVRRIVNPEGLLSANRTIQANLTFDTDSGCSDSPQSDTDTLPMREPIPSVSKTGWNYDAGQRQGSRSSTVYGNNNDDIVWRIRIDNNGLAGLQDLRFDDLMQSGSLVVSNICTTQGSANTIAANDGVGTASGCVPASNNIDDFIVTDPFGDMGLSFDGHEVDLVASGGDSIYLVGKITNSGSCETSKTNTVDDVQWGCEEQSPAGGIIQTSSGNIPGDVSTFYSRYTDDHPRLSVERRLTGTNTSQPVGSKGIMTITLRNNSGGSLKNIHLADLLPPEYVVDSTFPPEVTMNPAFGTAYDGMVDTLIWTNENTTDPLANIAPEFDLTSNGVTHPIYSDQVNMLRQDDEVIVRFRVVLIESDYYDRAANLDVNPEEYPVTATDPSFQTPLSNTLTVDFDLFCATQGSQTLVLTGNGTGNPAGSDIAAFPEDLDVAIGGNVFILTNDPNQLLTIPIELTNNGGHDAADYHAFVSFGATMEVVDAPSDCDPIALFGSPNQPDPWKVLVLPAPIPATAEVYECDSPAVISPGETVTFDFDVRKTTDPIRLAIDDLSLRADVVGEITLSDGTPLDFPTPISRFDGELDRANNYSVDATWARVIGFNLKKSQIGTCNENNPPSFDSNIFEEVQIGEECLFHIETGGWFGFKTPGFAYIAVQNIDVADELPDGQSYISNTDPYAQSTPLIKSVTLNPAGLSALDEGPFDWRFNVTDSEQIQVADEWFVVDAKTRLLNKPVDQRLSPNVHAGNSHNVLTSAFDATFKNDNTGLVEKYTLGPGTVGYPNEAIRRVDLTVTEPYLTVIKDVCNESLYGSGLSCSNFVPLADDGDAYNSYLYRITLRNEANHDGVQRAPAYDVIVTDQFDGSDLAYLLPFDSDGLDNDGDGLIGGTDSDGEGSISDNIVKNAVPPLLTFSYTHSAGLQRIDPGQSVELFYRVDYDDDAAPQQTFINTAEASYDSLSGDFGSQSNPQQPNSVLAGARVYSSDPAAASVRIIPVETQPKSILSLVNTPLLTVPGVQDVSVGEEIEYRLDTLLPVALLRNFVIRDELPTGLRCSEAPFVNLDAAPYNAAGFEPGGIITPTCGDDFVEWNFGNQRLTIGNASNRYDFAISFIAQVENSSAVNDGDLISNGHPATVTTAEYVDENSTLVSIDFGQVDIRVREPLIALSKSFSVAQADAEDTLTVTVTATNNGTATAYNLRVLDNLDGTDLSYAGNVGGSEPPDSVDIITLGANQPIFSWNIPNGINVGDSVSFTFAVNIATSVQPLQILSNSIQADWTSLPGQTTALNSTGSIGNDGNLTGMRNGVLPNSGHAINDYETETDSQVTISAAALSKTDLDSSTIPTIGAHKLFRIDVELPEGISNGVTVTDSLNAAGLSYVLANNATFDISYSFDGIDSINGQVPDETAFNVFPLDGTSGNAIWDIGTLVTLTEDDSSQTDINPAIHIEYYARVNNDLDTDAGDMLQNGVVSNYLNGETGLPETLSTATAVVAVSEPDLTLSKTLANVTDGKNPADPPFAGDILEYRVTAINTGSSNSISFDVNIVDTLPAGLVLHTGFTPTAIIDSISVPGFVSMPAGAPAGPLVWGRDNGDESLDIPAGQTLVVTYRTLVQVIADPAGLIENGVWSDWTSLTGVNPYERTGDGCPIVTAPDDYCVGPVFATTTGIAPELVFQKSVINETSGENPGVNASPGDTLRYSLQVTNISTAPAMFSVTDELDQLNAPTLFSPGSLNVISTASGTDASDPNGGNAGTGLVAIGDLILDGGESLTIEFTVQLAPVIPDGRLVLNQAQLLLSGLGLIRSDDPNQAGDEDPTQTLISSTPEWTVEKTAQDLSGASTILFAGDLLRYTIAIKNIGTENATDVVLRDLIPANTSYIAESTLLNSEAVTDPAPGISPLETSMEINAPEDLSGGVMRADAVTTPDNVAIVVFDVQVNENTASGTLISNQGFVNGMGVGSGAFPEQPSDDPLTAVVNDPTLNFVSSVAFQKSVFNETSGGDGAVATPGDILRYRLDITNTGTVTLNDLSLIDELESLQSLEPQLFVAGTLTMITVPPSVDVTGTDPVGGSKGTGLVDISGFNVAAGETLTVEFTAQLAPAIVSGTQVLNQAELSKDDQLLSLSDDDDPAADGDEDPTVTLINSAPVFEVLKTSTILSGDPGVLMAGELLRYKLTMENIGTEDAHNAILRDYIPANTSYVANSTTLNGSAVADPETGISPLRNGLLIHSPQNPAAGFLPAVNISAGSNIATVTFDVRVDLTVLDGLIIENQGFLAAEGIGSGTQPEQPSDDPSTLVLLDPTRNIVGNLPLLSALKTVQLEQDFGSPGIVDTADVLRYTIEVSNRGAIPASGVVFTDQVPVDTTYLADSMQLNGVPVGIDNGVSPLVGGLTIQSSDLPGAGVVSSGERALITFDVRVNIGVPTGTLISNQGHVTSIELPTELTDADGLPANGLQPTVVVVGDVQLLSITKQVLVVGGGTAEAGGQLEYLIQVRNIGNLPATHVKLTDDLAGLAGQASYLPGSATMNGLVTGVTFSVTLISADYAAEYGDLLPGAVIDVRFRVQTNSTLAIGTTLSNIGEVSWSDPAQTASANAVLDLGGTPGSSGLNGRLWHDANLDRLFSVNDIPLVDWSVELYQDNLLQISVLTDGDGDYRFSGLVPNDILAASYELRFRAPGAGPNTATLGYANSIFTNAPHRISDITVASGGNLQNLNLPASPNGTVYDSVLRVPVAGARLILRNAATSDPLPAACFDDPHQQQQVTLGDGHYRFDLNFSDPACQPGNSYVIEVAAPATGYLPVPSVTIPPEGGSADYFSVPDCPGSADDALPATTEYCEVTASAEVPPLSVPPRTAGTSYYLNLILDNGMLPGQSQLFNNHIPLDPELDGAVAISKTAAWTNVSRGQQVPYTITVSNVLGVPLYDIGIIDRFPAGFKYVPDSARFDGAAWEPQINGQELLWDGLELQVNDKHTIQLLLVVGSGVSEGEFTNRAQVINTASSGSVSGLASATVRVTPDPTFDCTDVIGKVYDDQNLNGQQEEGEPGLAGVRVVTVRGLIANTDQYGRFHITCAMVPDEDRGSNFILKLDDRSLPTGYRVISENPRVQRATRGKMLRFNFGAALHRVVSIDIADGVFETDSVELRPQWQPKLKQLIEVLSDKPSILRLSYLADVEEEQLVKKRIQAMRKVVSDSWSQGGQEPYRLTIESEVFWRRGSPL